MAKRTRLQREAQSYQVIFPSGKTGRVGQAQWQVHLERGNLTRIGRDPDEQAKINDNIRIARVADGLILKIEPNRNGLPGTTMVFEAAQEFLIGRNEVRSVAVGSVEWWYYMQVRCRTSFQSSFNNWLRRTPITPEGEAAARRKAGEPIYSSGNEFDFDGGIRLFQA